MRCSRTHQLQDKLSQEERWRVEVEVDPGVVQYASAWHLMVSSQEEEPTP